MKKIITSINITLDGFCDHTAGIADDELHRSVNELFRNIDTLIMGRVTYQLMENSWPQIAKNPTGNKSFDEFAVLIDKIPKIVFSRTLKKVEWKNTTLAGGDIKDEVVKLKKQPGKNILAGGPSIIIQLLQLGLVDECRFYIHPVILGHGLALFKNINDRINLKLLKTEKLGSGVVIVSYEPVKN